MAKARIIDVDARDVDEDEDEDDEDETDLESDFELLHDGLVIHVVRGAGRGRVNVIGYQCGELVHEEAVTARQVVQSVLKLLQRARNVASLGANLLRDLADELEGRS